MSTETDSTALPGPPVPDTAGAPAGARHAHDPTVVQAPDGTFVMFSTDALAGGRPDAGVHVRTSPDLVTWTWAGTALGHVPAEALAWTGAEGLWAPEVVRWPTADGSARFHMYYSASTFGSSTSAIGLAVAEDLAGPWDVRGLVVRTRAGEQTQNAIDAAVTWDGDGDPWLTYGSFFSGIYTLRLDRETGLPVTPGDLGTCIARRAHSVEAAIEGAFVVRRPGATADDDRYVLFVSYDSLFSTYNVRVAVADRITGPYRDRHGALMTDVDRAPDSVGTRVLVGHRRGDGEAWVAPGHCSVLHVGSAPHVDASTGVDLLVHHVRYAADPSEHVAQVRRIVWTRSGWPAVAPEPYAGEGLEVPLSTVLGPDPRLAGTWDVLDLRDAPATTASGPVTASRLVEVPDGDLTATALADGVVFASRDQVTGTDTLSFAGYTAHGTAVSGTLRPASD